MKAMLLITIWTFLFSESSIHQYLGRTLSTCVLCVAADVVADVVAVVPSVVTRTTCLCNTALRLS